MKFATLGLSAALLLSAAMANVGCESGHQPNVTSDYRSQWTDVAADTKTVTAAAEQVFKENELTDVSSQSTMVDGMASGVTADKTKIQAAIKKTDSGSQLSITVGKLGSPKMGADLVTKIKQVAEKKAM